MENVTLEEEVSIGFSNLDSDEGISYSERSLGLVLQIFYSMVGVAGVLGNGFVLYIIYRVPHMRDATNLLILNQSLLDFVASLFLLACFVPPVINLPSIKNAHLVFIICALWDSKYPFWGAALSSSINLIAITLERYFAVMHPIRYQRTIRKRKVIVAVCLLVWMLGYAYELIWVLSQRVVDGICKIVWPHPAMLPVFGLGMFIMQILIPIPLMIFVYTSVHLALHVRVQPVPNESCANEFPPSPKEVGSQSHPNAINIALHPQSSVTSNMSEDEPELVLARIDPQPQPSQVQKSGGMSYMNRDTGFPAAHPPSNHVGMMSHLRKDDSIESASVEQRICHAGVTARRGDHVGVSRRPNGIGRRSTTGRQNYRVAASRNILKTFVLVCIVYAVCWIPNKSIFMYYALGGKVDFSGFTYLSATCLAYCNLIINPVIYTFQYKKFKLAVKKAFGSHNAISHN